MDGFRLSGKGWCIHYYIIYNLSFYYFFWISLTCSLVGQDISLSFYYSIAVRYSYFCLLHHVHFIIFVNMRYVLCANYMNQVFLITLIMIFKHSFISNTIFFFYFFLSHSFIKDITSLFSFSFFIFLKVYNKI